MARTGKVDYHIHYYLDKCANGEMKLENIVPVAMSLHLEEIAIIKHYSDCLPNNKEKWVDWKRIDPEKFDLYLKEMKQFTVPKGIHILSGVETELLDESGKINISPEKAAKVDVILLSVHWMPELEIIHKIFPVLINPYDPVELAAIEPRWNEVKNDIGCRQIINAYVTAYINALQNNEQIKVLAHMRYGCDLLERLGLLGPNIDLVECFEPLFEVVAKRNVLWEINSPVKHKEILLQANKKGVKFVATKDSHSLSVLKNRLLIEQYIDSLGLNKGVIYKKRFNTYRFS